MGGGGRPGIPRHLEREGDLDRTHPVVEPQPVREDGPQGVRVPEGGEGLGGDGMVQIPSPFPVFKEQRTIYLERHTHALATGRDLFFRFIKWKSFMSSIHLSFKHNIRCLCLFFFWWDTHRGCGESKRNLRLSGGREGAAQHPSLSAGTGQSEAPLNVCVGGQGARFCHHQFRCQGSLQTNPSPRIHKFVEGTDQPLNKDPDGG